VENVTDRFKAVYKYLEKEKIVADHTDFSKQTGISRSMLTEIFENRSGAGTKTLQKTVTKFKMINPGWLYAGEGKMINDANPISSKPDILKGKEIKTAPMLDVHPAGNASDQEKWDSGESLKRDETVASFLAKNYSPVALGSLYVLGQTLSAPLDASDLEKLLKNYKMNSQIIYLHVKAIYEMDSGQVSWTTQKSAERKQPKKREAEHIR
jgi:hypothetical protein